MMSRVILEGILPITWIVYTIWVSISRWKYKRLVAISNNYLLALPKKDREEHARRLLQREDDEYFEKVIKRQTDPLRYLDEK